MQLRRERWHEVILGKEVRAKGIQGCDWVCILDEHRHGHGHGHRCVDVDMGIGMDIKKNKKRKRGVRRKKKRQRRGFGAKRRNVICKGD